MGNSNTYNLYELSELIKIDPDIGNLIPERSTHAIEDGKDENFQVKSRLSLGAPVLQVVCGHNVNFYLKRVGPSPGVKLAFTSSQNRLIEGAKMTKNPPLVNDKDVYDATRQN